MQKICIGAPGSFSLTYQIMSKYFQIHLSHCLHEPLTYHLWCIPFITQYYSGKRCLIVYQQSILNKMEHFISQLVTRSVVGAWLEQGGVLMSQWWIVWDK